MSGFGGVHTQPLSKQELHMAHFNSFSFLSVHPIIQQAFSGYCINRLPLGYNVGRNKRQISGANNQILISPSCYASCRSAMVVLLFQGVFRLLGSRIKEQSLSGMRCSHGRGGRELVKWCDASWSFFWELAHCHFCLHLIGQHKSRDRMGCWWAGKRLFP